jgi:hypothetical protein
MSHASSSLSRSTTLSATSHAHSALRSARLAQRPVHAPELRVEEIRFRQLRAAEDIRSILHLRSEINLPSAGQAGFAALEKKETSWASSAASNGAATTSARSGWCRWA